MLSKHNQNEAVLKCCKVSDRLGVKYLFFWCKNFNLALTLLITFWAIDSPDIVSSSIQYNPGKSLKNVALFKYCYICDALCDLGSVTIWHLHGRSNAYKCMLMLFSTFMLFLSVCMSLHGIQMGLSNDKGLNAIQMGKH